MRLTRSNVEMLMPSTVNARPAGYRRLFAALGATLSLAAGPALAAPITVTLQPGPEGKDTFIDSRGVFATQNYGTSHIVQFGHADNSNGNIGHGLIEFDLTGLPTTSITLAQLWMFSTGGTAGSPMPVAARTIGSA